MPKGTTHALISAGAAGAMLYLTYSSGPSEALALASGCLAGILISPDLDVDDGSLSTGIVRREAGRIPAFAWRALWYPYARLIRHRSWLSHFPFIGTALRIAYLGLIAWLILLLLGHPWPWASLPDWVPFAMIGLSISDLMHWAADGIFSTFQRRQSRRRGILDL
jgi:uncharacterized metal-binding protein